MKNGTRVNIIINCLLIILVIFVFMLPDFYYRKREWEDVQAKMERKLKERYGIDFTIKKRKSLDKFEADVTSVQYDVNDPYYCTKATVYIYPFGIMSDVKGDWEAVKYKLEREKLFLEKSKEIFQENIVIKESSVLRTDKGYISNPKIGREEIEKGLVNEKEQFELKLDIFIFQTIKNEEEVIENQKKIHQFIQYLKEKNVFDYSDIFIHYVDKRILAPSFDRFSKYIEKCPLERQEFGDSYTYLPHKYGRIIISRALSAEINCMSDKEIEEKVNTIPKKDLDYAEKLLEKCQYNVNIVTVERLKSLNYRINDSRYKMYETKEKNNTLYEHVYDDWEKVKLVKNGRYYFAEIDKQSEKAGNYLSFNESGEELIEAVENVNMINLRKLINNKVNINYVDEDGFTPLMKAVDRLNLLMTRELLKTDKIEDLITPLSIAIDKQLEEFVDLILAYKPDLLKSTLLRDAESKGNQNIVKKLIKAGVNSDIPLKNGVRPIINAIKEDDTEKVRLLIKAGTELDFKDDYGLTPLIYAVNYGNSTMVSMILDQGVNIDERNKKGWPALIFAAENGNSEMVSILIKKGAYVNTMCYDGKSVLYYAEMSEDQKTIDILKQAGANHDNWNYYFAAAQYGYVEKIKELQAKGLYINARDENDNTALMFAVSHEQTEVVELLIKAGIDINRKNKDGYTPLILAVYLENDEIIRSLIQGRVNINDKSKYLGTPLVLALLQDNIEIARMLVEAGADVNAKASVHVEGNIYRTIIPIKYVVDQGNIEMAKLLISSGVDNESLNNALKIAKRQNDSKMVRILEEELKKEKENDT